MQSSDFVVKAISAIISIADIYHELDSVQLRDRCLTAQKSCPGQDEITYNYKKNRRLFVQEIQSLVHALTMYSDVTASNVISTVEEFEAIETRCSNLLNVATSYKQSLSKQRCFVLSQVANISDLFALSGSENIKIKSGIKEESLIKYILLYRTISSQFKKQMDWEAAVIVDVMSVLQDGTVYSHIHGDENKDGLDYSKYKSGTSYQIRLAHKLKEWVRGFEGSLLLDKALWLETNDFLRKIAEGFVCKPDKHRGITNGNSGVYSKVGALDVSGQKFRTLGVIQKACISVKNKIQSCHTIRDVLRVFVSHKLEQRHSRCNSTFIVDSQSDHTMRVDDTDNTLFLLLLGSSGSGISHVFDSIQYDTAEYIQVSDAKNFIKDINVIRPKLPVDFLGGNVGSFEGMLLSLFTNGDSKRRWKRKYIILLDNIGHIIGEEDNESSRLSGNIGNALDNNERHIMSRTKSIFLTIIDRIKYVAIDAEFVVICSAKTVDDGILKRFDKVFHLEEDMNSIESRRIIEQHLNFTGKPFNNELDELMARAVESTIGRSKGEIAYFCRQALNHIPEDDGELIYRERLLQIIENHRVIPDSIRQASHDGFVELNVLGADDLRKDISLDQNGVEVLPLLGRSAIQSWTQLANVIIAPLCSSPTLDILLDGGNQASFQVSSRNKSITSGVLLTGNPGSGKTTIAYHCAAVAAGFDPSIRCLVVSCTSLIHKEVGGSERAIKKLFDTARATSPCILMLDGIENIAPVRGNDNTSEGTMDRMLSVLLTEMDGIAPDPQIATVNECVRISIIGITHDPSWIDSALRRPGRLEKCVHLEQPDYNTRKDLILKEIVGLTIDLSGSSFSDAEKFVEELALITSEISAAEVISICKEARLLAMRENMKKLQGSGDDTESQRSHPVVKVRHFLPVATCCKMKMCDN